MCGCKAEKTAHKLKLVLQSPEVSCRAGKLQKENYSPSLHYQLIKSSPSPPHYKRLLKEPLLIADVLQISIPCSKDHPCEKQVSLNRMSFLLILHSLKD